MIKDNKELVEYAGVQLRKYIKIHYMKAKSFCRELCINFISNNLQTQALALIENFNDEQTLKDTYEYTSIKHPPFAATLLQLYPAQLNPPQLAPPPAIENPQQAVRPNPLGVASIFTFLIGTVPAAFFALIFSPWLALGILIGGVILTISSLALAISLK